MTIEGVVSRWRTEQTRFDELGALVDGAKLIGRILDDLETAQISEEAEELSLAEASQLSGYSTSQLSRLLRTGRLPNAGRPHAPRIRRADLPRKPPALRTARQRVQLVGAGPGQVARAIVANSKEAPR